MVDIQSIWAASARISPFIRRTPLEYSRVLSELTEAEVFLKMECWQHTGSFKPRGAFNCLQLLSDGQKRQGVVAPTAGNHGIGLAYAARMLGIPAHIFLPETTDPMKLAVLQSLHAELSMFPDIETARLEALQAAESKHWQFISAYNEEGMIAGGGTIGLEILQDFSEVDVVIACVGGGGLIAGIATVVKANNPAIEIWGAQAEQSPTFVRWFDARQVVPVDVKSSIAPGLSGTIEPDTITFPIIRDSVDTMTGLREDELVEGMRLMAEHHQQIVEPSGIAAVSAVLRHASTLAHKKVAVVVTGRNISFDEFRSLVS